MNRSSLVSLSKAISSLSAHGKIVCARKLFDGMPQRDTVAWNLMMQGYVDNGRMKEARELFDEMPEKNSASWNSMIMAYACERKPHVAFKIFLTMPDECKDVVSWTTIIVGLARNLQIADSWRVFRAMPVEPSSEAWSSIISGFHQAGLASEALLLFKEMLSVGMEPTSHSFTTALTTSADLAALSKGLQIHCHVVKRGMEVNSHVMNAAISMYMKSGSLENAMCLFHEMPERDMVSWNSMIMGFGQHGYGVEAIILFHQMQKAGFRPNRISFLGVLYACSHCGFLDEGKRYFNCMYQEYGVTPGPEHYACMVDLQARAGHLKEAVRMTEDMPFGPVSVFWRSILNGCRITGDLELGLYAAKKVLELEPSDAAACLMIMEMCEAVGCGEEAAEVRMTLKDRRDEKEVGCSWIEVKGRTHAFTTRDETHPESDCIHMMIKLLIYAVAEMEFG